MAGVEDGLDDFIGAVADALRAQNYDVVLPGDDADLLALSWGRDRLPALLPYAPHEAVVRAIDKLELTRCANEAGLATPATLPASDEAVSRVGLPVVVKSRLHWSPEAPADDRHLLAAECDTREDVVKAVDAMRAMGGLPLLQERVNGALMAVSAVVGRDGRVLAVSQQETDRLSLRRTSVSARTVPVDRDLEDGVRRLLAVLGWWGLANLQFLRDDNGQPRLIDFNGRFYGSLALAIRAGADLPAIWVRDALGGPAGPLVTARSGVRFHAFEEDLRRARAERAGGLARDVARVAAAATRSTHTTWSTDDPRPALLRVGRIVGSATGRRIRHRLS